MEDPNLSKNMSNSNRAQTPHEKSKRSILELLSFSEDVCDKLRALLGNKDTQLDIDQEDALYEIISRYLDENTGDLHVGQLLPADTGWGKTRVSLYVALIMNLLFGMNLLVICPANIRIQWAAAIKDLGLKPLGVYSYEEIRGQKSSMKCKHPYLTRESGEHGPFFATKEWYDQLAKGVFLILDESQKLKNDSGQHYACVELIYTLCNRPPVISRLLHLTASFIDKPDNWKSLMRCFGYTRQTEMMSFNPGRQIIEYAKYGVGDIRTLAEKINYNETKKVFTENPLSAANLPNLLHQLWVRVFRAHVVIPVVDPIYVHPVTKVPFKRRRYNAFYELDIAGQEKAIAAIQKLKRANIVRDDGFVDIRAANATGNFGLIQRALMELCEAKLFTVVRLALDDLRSHPTRKIILSIPFIAGQDEVLKHLKLYGPLVLNGDVKMDHRPEIIAKFNEPNTECRVIIMTPEVGGIGISLHDTHGEYPRRLRMVSTFNFNSCFQSTGRPYRRGLMSDVDIYIMYAANVPLESILLNTLIKSKVCGDVMIPGSLRVFPGEYDIFIENEHKYKDLRKNLMGMQKMSLMALKQAK